MSGERAKGERGHEARGRARHHHTHVGAFLHEQPQELRRLVGRDPPRDPEHDLLSLELHGFRPASVSVLRRPRRERRVPIPGSRAVPLTDPESKPTPIK